MVSLLALRAPRVSVWPPLPLPPGRLGPALLLALLLHLWLVLLIGTAPGGSALPGEGVWGRLEVTLTGPKTAEPARPETPALPAPAAAPDVDTGPAGTAPRRRYGGAVRTTPAPVTEQPGAAELGRWRATPGAQPEGAAESSGEAMPSPRLQTLPEPVEKPQPAVTRVQPAAPRATAEPLKSLPTLAPIATPEPETPAPPVELPPPPVLRTLPDAAPAERSSRPARENLSAPLPTPAPQPQLSAPKPLPEIAPAPVPAPAPVAAPTPAPTPSPAPGAAVSDKPATAAPSTSVPAAPSLAPIAPPVGRPDAGTRVGQDVATPPSASASAPRQPLDLRLPVNGPMSRQAGNSLLNLMPHPPDTQTKMAEDMKKTGRGDCRNEHADKGILAVVPLVADTARDKGCKW